MKRILENYRHTPGRHCGSTALSGWFCYYGHAIDEPLAFGLGAGLGAVYLENPSFSPSRLFMTRGALLESQAFQSLGIGHADRCGADASEVWKTNQRMIDAGTPVILACDLAHLPYWNTKTHFNGHRITWVGYDDDQRVAYLADTHFEGLQSCPYDALLAARTSKYPPGMGDSHYHDPDIQATVKPLDQAIATALVVQADDLLEHRMGQHGGVAGLRLMAEQLPTWGESKDWKWCYRFSYQIIEKRGTGGAGFRKLYAEFLEQASSHVEAIGRLGLAALMRENEQDWTALAGEFYRLSEADAPGDPGLAMDILKQIATREERFALSIKEDTSLRRKG